MLNKKENQPIYGYLIIALMMALVGICLISFTQSIKVLTIVLGALLTVYGIIIGILGIAMKSRNFAFVLKIVIAVSALICGIITMIFNEKSASIITSVFLLLLIIDGSFKLGTSINAKRYDVKSWWFMLIFALPVIISSYILLDLVELKIETQSLLIGIIIIIDAIANAFSAFYVRQCEKKMQAKIFYDMHKEGQ